MIDSLPEGVVGDDQVNEQCPGIPERKISLHQDGGAKMQ